MMKKFWDEEGLPDNPKRIGFFLSGGTDSALLLYITCKHFQHTDTEIIPLTSNRVGFMEDTPGANKIIGMMREWFPGIKIRDTEDHTFKRVHPEPFVKYDVPEFISRNKVDLMMSGRTLAPSRDEPGMEDVHETHILDLRSGKNQIYSAALESSEGYLHYHPLATVDKKWVAAKYKEYGLMDTLFPVTVSCVALSDFYLLNHSGPCRECFWCKEKFWAFGCYDGGVK